MSIYSKFRVPVLNLGSSLNRRVWTVHDQSYSIFSRKKEKEAAEEEAIEFLQDPKPELSENEIMQKRNKSRLAPHHWRKLNGEVPHPEAKCWIHHTIEYKKKVYAKYGEKSGLNPGILWPVDEDLKEKLEYEAVAHPFTIQELFEKKNALRAEEQRYIEERTKEIEQNMTLLEGEFKKLEEKEHLKLQEIAKAKAKKERLIEEVRRHFGYTVDPRDEKFKEMIEQKEKEEKKAMKEAKKLEKQNKMLERLAAESKIKNEPSPKDS